MNFPEAINAILENGWACRRYSWRPTRRVHLIMPLHHPEALPYLEIITDEGRAPYVPAQCDMQATDWVEYVEPPK